MQIPRKQPASLSKWVVLFMPEDTDSPYRRYRNPSQRHSALGCLKFWMWIAISIAVAVGIGQL